jgi:protein-L-isoaspartate(D-aspartate) O-methyltransferase
LTEQLADGGRLVQPIGRGGSEQVMVFEKVGPRLAEREVLTGARFVPLCGRHGFAPPGGDEA